MTWGLEEAEVIKLADWSCTKKKFHDKIIQWQKYCYVIVQQKDTWRLSILILALYNLSVREGWKVINHSHTFLIHVCRTFSKYFDLKSMAWHQNILLSVQYFLLPTWSIFEFRAVSFPKWIILIIWAAEASIVLFGYSCGYDVVINCSVKKCNSVEHLMI